MNFIIGAMLVGALSGGGNTSHYRLVPWTPRVYNSEVVEVYGGDCDLYGETSREIGVEEFKTKTLKGNCLEIETHNEGYVHQILPFTPTKE